MKTPGTSSKPFAWGVVASGPVAREFANDLPYVTERACFVKAVLGSEDDEALTAFAGELSLPQVYTDMTAFLEEAQVDAVYIGAPAPFRFPYVVRCLQGRIPVLCESPMLGSTAQADALAEVVARTGVFCMESMSLRFLPSLYALLSVLHTKSIGNIISVKASLGGRTVVLEEDYGHPGVGALMALGSYPIFLSLLLLGEPLSVQATGRLSPDGRDDCCTSLVTFEGGRYASLECSWIKGARDEALITGDKGSITLHDRWHRDPGDLSIALEGKVILRRHNAWEGRGQQFVVSEVLRCLDSGLTESDLMRLTMSRRIAAVTEEIRAQLSSGSPMASTAAFS